MIPIFRFLFFLINTTISYDYNLKNKLNFNLSLNNEIQLKSNISLKINELWRQVQEGLSLEDIENLVLFILLIRFLILALKYNLKTSFYITFIGVLAAYLWYRHLIDIIGMYRTILIRFPYFYRLGINATNLRSSNNQIVLTDLKLENNVHWYNPGQLLYYAFIKGIIQINSETGLKYYIDPISMFISKLDKPTKESILPIYYKIYNKLIPQLFEGIAKFWTQLSGIASYAVITRIGKRYCPYLVRWHWTFLLIIGFIEQILIYFCYRITYFQSNVLIPKVESNFLSESQIQNILIQISSLNGLLALIISFHLGLIFFGLLNAILGQYFYFPFLVENTELHIGPRPKNSIYSGGNTSWQDLNMQNSRKLLPKLWYGWFGKPRLNNSNFFILIQKSIKIFLKLLRRPFRR